MKIVFMGTPEFAVPSLDILLKNNYEIAGVVTATDKPAGRGNKIQVSPVKQYAVDHGLPVLQPDKLKDPSFIKSLESLKADLFVVVAFRMLPEVVWKMPVHGTFNLHGSLLPQYRGAAPINWAVINGETETGATTFFIDEKIDTGNIIFFERIKIGKDTTAGELHDEMMIKGSELVLKTVQVVEKGNYTLVKQTDLLNNLGPLKPAPKLNKETCKINWNTTSLSVHNLIRGLSPFPGAWTEFKRKSPEEILPVKIYKSSVLLSNDLEVGEMQSDNKNFLHIGCAEGAVSIKNIQFPGKKRLAIEDFLRGHSVDDYEIIL